MAPRPHGVGKRFRWGGFTQEMVEGLRKLGYVSLSQEKWASELVSEKREDVGAAFAHMVSSPAVLFPIRARTVLDYNAFKLMIMS